MKKARIGGGTPIFVRLFLMFSCFALIPINIISALSFYITYQILYQNLGASVSSATSQMTLLIDNKLEEMRYVSDQYASNTELKKLLRMPKTDANILLLHNELKKTNLINAQRGYYVTVFGDNGQIYLNWESDGMIYRNPLAQRIQSMEWYQMMEENRGKPIWIPYMMNIAGYDNPKQVISVVRNIINDSLGGADILGLTVISASLQQTSEILKSIDNNTFVVDETQRIILHQDVMQIGQYSQIEGGLREGVMSVQVDGEKYLSAIKKNKVGNMYTITMAPVNLVARQMSFAAYLILFLTVASIGITLLVAYWFSKSLARPILALENHMQEIQTQPLTPAVIKTDLREIKGLTESFNRMLTHIQTLILERVREEQMRKEIEVQRANAELQFLRAQINPHFLFNTLNSIKCMAILNGAQPVEQMITALGRLLECSMQKDNDFLPLREEIENVKAYIRIQQMRYGESLKAQYDLQEDILDTLVPKLILQPLVENAIIHGIEKNNDGGIIHIRAFSQNKTIFVEIADNGPGITSQQQAHFTKLLESNDQLKVLKEDSEQKRNRLSGIGIENVHKRLQLLYGKSCGLSFRLDAQEKGTVAVVTLKGE